MIPYFPQMTISRMIESFNQNGSVADLVKSMDFDKDQDFTIGVKYLTPPSSHLAYRLPSQPVSRIEFIG
jgi:hypothetical protein